MHDFIEYVFSSTKLARSFLFANFFCNKTILFFRNNFAILFNDQILASFYDDKCYFLSSNTIFYNKNKNMYKLNTKYLQTLKSFEFSSSQLYLKIKTLIILLQNLYFNEELSNDSELIVTRLY